jgi:hypothetical protein
MRFRLVGWPVEPAGPVEPVKKGKMPDFIFFGLTE